MTKRRNFELAFGVGCTKGSFVSVVLPCDLGSVLQIQGGHLE